MLGLPYPLRAATLELSQARLDVFDPAGTVMFLADRGFNTVVCFALGYLRGEAYYASAIAPARQGLNGHDLFGEVVEACAARGLAVIAYVNSLFGPPEAYEPHPDWVQRWADGSETTQGEAKALCPNSPYGAQIRAIAAEVAARYPIDGLYLDEPSLQSWCACDYCRDRYQRETGRPLPTEVAFDDPAFAAFLEWRSEVVAELVADVGVAVRQARPGVQYFAQHAFPLASTSQAHIRRLFWGRSSGRMPPQFDGWYRPSFYGQDIVKTSRTLDLVSIEPWRRFSGMPAWWEGACVSYARAASGGKPVMPLMEYAHFPWGMARLSDSELSVDCADVTANGGELWFPMYAPDAADRGGWDALGRIFGKLAEARRPGDTQYASIGVVISRRTAERFGRDAVEERYLDGAIGTIGLVRALHVPYKVLSAEALREQDLAGIEVLVVPGAACLNEREAGLIRDYVANGGGLVATGWTATHDDTGVVRPCGLLDDVLGIALGPGEVHAGIGYLVRPGSVMDGTTPALPVRDEQPAVTPSGADVEFELLPAWDLFTPPAEVPTHPSITVHKFGSGRASYCGPTGHAIGISSGTAALHLALRALGVGPGDEVITVPNTYVATGFAISYVGAVPVFVDVDPETANMDPTRVAAAVTEKTKAILPVHMYGQCVDIEAIRAAAPGIPILEDAAHAHGATYDGRKAGSLGEIAAFSFYPSKLLGALGDGGAITTSDDDLDALVRQMRYMGQKGVKHEHLILGYQERLDEVQAAFLRVKLRHLEEQIEARRRVAARYRDWLADTPVQPPAHDVTGRHAYYMYTVLVPHREQLVTHLAAEGIHTQLIYPKLVPDQGAYANNPWRAADPLDVARSLVPRLLCLPMFAELTDEEVDRVGRAIRDFYGVA